MKSILKSAIILATFLGSLGSQHVFAQNRYVERNGEIQFEASEKLFEEVKATNESVTGILDVATGEIAVLGLVKGFRFKNSLMEEHFNENYIESEKYPKATFKGKLNGFDFESLTDNWTNISVDGKLTLHGKEKLITPALMFRKLDGSVVMKGSFIAAPSDFDIKIPKIVENKIAKEVTINVEFNFSKK